MGIRFSNYATVIAVSPHPLRNNTFTSRLLGLSGRKEKQTKKRYPPVRPSPALARVERTIREHQTI